MRISLPDSLRLQPQTADAPELALQREKTIALAGLAAIVLLAAVLRFANLEALGYANHYYTAAVKAMLQSWHNFFFAAAEPGGSVSVDKPPVGLWLQAIPAYFLGVNGFAVLLPQLLAGIASVIVLYHLVRRSFGVAAGLLAALVLAITPVVVATDRNNTIDSTLILVLLLAAWAYLKATETGRMRFLVLGAVLVGIGFNIKMLEAYLPLPAFYALYLLGSSESFRRKLGKITLTTVLLLAVSLSWAVAVDLTPASQRPYVGSSGNNSEMSLIVGYNGMERLLGMFRRPGVPGAARFTNPGNGGAPFRIPGGNNLPPFQPGQNGGFQPQFPNGGGFPRPGRNDGGGAAPFGRLGGGGMFNTGQPGLLRLWIPPLSKEVSWLLPLGVLGALLLAFRNKLRWPVVRDHQALVLWGGWLLTAGVFFSVAGFFHEYYLSTMGAPLAALAAAGAAGLWQLRESRPWLAFGLLVAGAGGTLAFQAATARAFVGQPWWLPFALALLAVGLLALLAATFRRQAGKPGASLAGTGLACVLAAVLVTPGIWSGLTNSYSSGNQSLPAAYSGERSGVPNRGGIQVNQNLLQYLQANTQGMKYLMAVPSSMQGADYVIATGRPVLYLGGFMGQDRVITGTGLSDLVRQGQLRYIFWNSGGGGMGSRSDITAWVSAQCRAVQGFNTTMRNFGAPDGTSAGQDGQPGGWNGGGFGGPGGEMNVSLYDCAG